MSRKDFLFIGFAGLILSALWFDLAPRVSGNQATLADHREQSTIAQAQTVALEIDQEFEADWESAGLSTAPPADAYTICRRLSLALTGTVPSFAELRQLESIAESERVNWWLDHLFHDRRYSNYVAERLARVYVGVEEGPFLVFRRRRFTTWLSDSLLENKPYDQIVRELIADSGVWTEKPGVNFLTVTAAEGKPDEVRLAGRTTRAFLGIRLDCMQCHDDNLNGRWAQSDFHELAAFFSEAQNSITGIIDKPRIYKTTYLDEEDATKVQPNVPFGEELVSDDPGTRRNRLANWVTHPENQAFSRATVNRAWALLFGRPLVEPVDNIPLEGPYPPAMETLAQDFSDSGFDLQHLIRTIASSRVFRMDSKTDKDSNTLSDEHEKSWAIFPLTRLRPEQVAGALMQSARLDTINTDSHIFLQLKANDGVASFVRRYGDTGEDEFDSHGGTIPQRLLMMNGNLVKESTKQDLIANAATRIAALSPSDKKAIRATYAAILTREPSEKELEHFKASLEGVTGNRRIRFFEDLYWVLLNSTEFSWNH